MIDRQVLKDMGFVIAHGWDEETWYHFDSDFWVHFGTDEKYDSIDHINGSATMKEFFEKFMANMTHSLTDAKQA